jgi:hypothetical protein
MSWRITLAACGHRQASPIAKSRRRCAPSGILLYAHGDAMHEQPGVLSISAISDAKDDGHTAAGVEDDGDVSADGVERTTTGLPACISATNNAEDDDIVTASVHNPVPSPPQMAPKTTTPGRGCRPECSPTPPPLSRMVPRTKISIITISTPAGT